MPVDSSTVPLPTAAPARRWWKWFFLLLLGLTLAATASLWWFNQHIQLTRAELDRQRQLWGRNRPEDYFLTYLRVENDESLGKFYKVHVRGGKVELAEEFAVRVRERREIEPLGGGTPLSPKEAGGHSMEALLEMAGHFLAADEREGRRAYVRARFHPENGALLDFVHRVMGSRQRIQISVVSFRFGDDLNQ